MGCSLSEAQDKDRSLLHHRRRFLICGYALGFSAGHLQVTEAVASQHFPRLPPNLFTAPPHSGCPVIVGYRTPHTAELCLHESLLITDFHTCLLVCFSSYIYGRVFSTWQLPLEPWWLCSLHDSSQTPAGSTSATSSPATRPARVGSSSQTSSVNAWGPRVRGLS